MRSRWRDVEETQSQYFRDTEAPLITERRESANQSGFAYLKRRWNDLRSDTFCSGLHVESGSANDASLIEYSEDYSLPGFSQEIAYMPDRIDGRARFSTDLENSTRLHLYNYICYRLHNYTVRSHRYDSGRKSQFEVSREKLRGTIIRASFEQWSIKSLFRLDNQILV